MDDRVLQDRLTAILDQHGLKIDDWRGGGGKFRDLYIGIGPWQVDGVVNGHPEKLRALVASLRSAGIRASLDSVSNPDHPDHGHLMVTVHSFWWED